MNLEQQINLYHVNKLLSFLYISVGVVLGQPQYTYDFSNVSFLLCLKHV